MRKCITLIGIVLVAFTSYAQKGKVSTALSYKESGDLKKAYETIEQTIDPNNERAEKSIPWPRTWEVRGEIFQELYRKDVTDIVDQPLFVAYDSYMKAFELDEKSRFSKSLVVDFTFLQTDLSNYAIKAFGQNKFAVAQECFEKYIAITNHPLMNTTGSEIVDTAIIHNAGLASLKAKDWGKAIKYFEQSIENDYNAGEAYYYTYTAYQAKGDTLNSFKVLKEGFQAFPENEAILVELINFYIKSGKPDDAITYLDVAIKNQPDNVTFYTAKGSALEKLGRDDDAVEVYKEAIAIDDSQFTPYYNLGVIYYNRGVNKVNEANQLPPSATKEYDEMIEAGKDQLRLALPFLEKAYSIDDSELAILESLRLIYYRLQMNDKYEQMNKKIKSVKN